ncbi:MAG: hypothetical protein ACOZB3_01945 [Calditrichota bacterium]
MISGLHHLVHCRAGTPNSCYFEILCQVTDPDFNARFDTITVYIESLYIGNLEFNPARGSFYLSRSDRDFTSNDIMAFRGDTVWVTAIDDSSAITTTYFVFTKPMEDYPGIRYPRDIDTIYTLHPTLQWFHYGGQNSIHTFNISVVYKQLFAAWDTVGLPATDTSVVVTTELINTAEIASAFYGWYLTVVDEDGNSMTSEPGIFKCFDLSFKNE